MTRPEYMDKVLNSIKAGEIMEAMRDLDTINFSNGLEGIVRSDFGQAIAFCLGVACGQYEQRMKGGRRA